MKAFAVLLAPTLLLVASPSPGQEANSADSQSFGRLFFTPERRVALERLRLSTVRETDSIEGATLSLDGVVARSSGKSTVWISGKPQHEGDAALTGIRARVNRLSPGTASVSAGDALSQSSMKVGDSINLGTQERQGILGSGSVKVAPTNGKR